MAMSPARNRLKKIGYITRESQDSLVLFCDLNNSQFLYLHSHFSTYDECTTAKQKYINGVMCKREQGKTQMMKKLLIAGAIVLSSSISMANSNIPTDPAFAKIAQLMQANKVKDAYLELEKLAKEPRVIIDPKILAFLNMDAAQLYKRFNTSNDWLVYQFEDGPKYEIPEIKRDSIFLDYLNCMRTFKEDNSSLSAAVNFFKEAMLVAPQCAYEKYVWIRNYFICTFARLNSDQQIHLVSYKKIIEKL